MPTQVVTCNVAGPFKAYYTGPAGSNITALSLGIIGAQGIKRIRKYEAEEYTADALGNSVVEGVYLGGQMFLEFQLEEANRTAVMSLENPFRYGSHTTGAANGVGGSASDEDVGIPGTFMTSYAGGLVLKPLYSASGSIYTTAGAAYKPVHTYGLVTLAAGFEKEKLFSSKRRVIPIRLRCYPYHNGLSSAAAKFIWYSVGDLTTFEIS